MRAGSERTVKVKLDERDSGAAQVAAADAPERPADAITFEKLGVSVEPLTSTWLSENGISGSGQGLRVTEVAPNRTSSARLQGLILTDVVQGDQLVPLKTEADLRTALGRVRSGDVITLRVRGVESGGGQRLVLSPPFVINVRVGS
jgi:S1-C subfamily serine protease